MFVGGGLYRDGLTQPKLLTLMSPAHNHVQDGRMFFYEAARAPDKASCEAHIEEIAKLNAAAGRFIRNAARHEWAMYATRGNVVLDQVTSNMSESVNSMMGEEVRLFRHLRCTFSLSFCFVPCVLLVHIWVLCSPPRASIRLSAGSVPPIQFAGSRAVAYQTLQLHLHLLVFACVISFSQTRGKAPLEFFQDIVVESGGKLAKYAEININNPAAVHTPFAASKFNSEMEWANT